MNEDNRISTVASCSQVNASHRGHVIVSGSYGGVYNAFNAARWNVRGIIMNDAGVGAQNAGIVGLDYLEKVGLPGATADAMSSYIGDGEDALANGVISHLNGKASQLGCAVGQTVRECAERMQTARLIDIDLPKISEGGRELILETASGRKVICADSAGMLEEGDTTQILVTGSHAALFQGKPDSIVKYDVFAIFFSDAGVGKGQAGISRLANLDTRNIIAATVSAESAPIGDSKAIYNNGMISFANETARKRGATPGMPLKAFIDRILA